MTVAPLLELDAVRIRHRGAERPTPDGVSHDIRAGQVVLLLGPSGMRQVGHYGGPGPPGLGSCR